MKRLCVGDGVVRWVEERVKGRFGPARGIGLERRVGAQWRMVAGVAYESHNGPNVVCHIAIDGAHAMTREWLRVIFDYPFNQIGVRRITVGVEEGNARSRRLVEHMGFRLEARLDRAAKSGDIFIYRMFRDECRFIARKEERKAA